MTSLEKKLQGQMELLAGDIRGRADFQTTTTRRQIDSLQKEMEILESKQKTMLAQAAPSQANAWTTAPPPQGHNMVIGNIGKDTPYEQSLRVGNAFIATLRSGPRLIPNASAHNPIGAAGNAKGGPTAGPGASSSSSAPTPATHTFAPHDRTTISAPWKLTFCVYVSLQTDAELRMVLAEARDRMGREFFFQNKKYDVFATILKTKEDRIRNQRLITIARTLQGTMNPTAPEATKSTHPLVCWKSGTVIVRNRRCCTIPRSFTTTGDEICHERWHHDATFHLAEDLIVQKVTLELQAIDKEA